MEDTIRICREIRLEANSWEVRNLAFVEINNVIDRLTRSRVIRVEDLAKFRQWQNPAWMILTTIPVIPPATTTTPTKILTTIYL
jgi:DNA-directed RNA polymerase beta' subunit